MNVWIVHEELESGIYISSVWNTESGAKKELEKRKEAYKKSVDLNRKHGGGTKYTRVDYFITSHAVMEE